MKLVIIDSPFAAATKEPWAVCSQIVEEEDASHVETGGAVGLREAKQLATRHAEELRKTWAAEGGAAW